MNIVFLCGALEPGRDGVGDYSRKLAGALVEKGHQVALAALKDGHVPAVTEGIQLSDEVEVPVLRVPASWPAAQRFSRAKEWIGRINPEWVSVQFVPYAFQAKGLPYAFAQDLKSLGGFFGGISCFTNSGSMLPSSSLNTLWRGGNG
ncbi:glycosyltransferase family 4 protein [Hymenobacter sp. HDW8]|uniref:glycosyltransferase family 4 protein n=1 Tax=Hymenobacter sp. HDW8 TaxID=2714932 RepID=UPI0014088751|nr:glycosyltransferase family 4 protein [Hymenobacter sp. HDW8]QIL75338.1 glycosyltransferase family 4 protein [Hymenobacter sp. HDW8]